MASDTVGLSVEEIGRGLGQGGNPGLYTAIKNKHGRDRDTETMRKVMGFRGDFSQHIVRLRGGIIKQLAALAVINTVANRMRLKIGWGKGVTERKKPGRRQAQCINHR